MKVSLDISPEDVGRDNYSGYVITEICINEEQKEIWSIAYKYIWDCGDGCCSDESCGVAHIGDLSDWLKKWVLEQMPGYHFQT